MKPDPPRIRRGSPEDVAVLAELAAGTFRDTFARQNTPADLEIYLERWFTPERIAAEIEDPGSTFLLAFSDPDERPIGYAKLRVGEADPSVAGPKPIQLERLYARREVIGQGVGAALLEACLGEAARAGRETVWLGVWERNERAIAFYRRWGFEEVGTQTFLLGTDEQNDLVMARSVARPVARPPL